MKNLALLFFLVLLCIPADAQPLADTLITWREFGRIGTTHVQVYPTPARDEDRHHTVIVREIAENRGPSTLDDARFLVEHVGRTLDIDPAEAHWVFHWGAFSFPGAEANRREFYLRATFRRTPAGSLTAPAWRLVNRTEVEGLTDRRYRRPPE
jgi:hypothetical protein